MLEHLLREAETFLGSLDIQISVSYGQFYNKKKKKKKKKKETLEVLEKNVKRGFDGIGLHHIWILYSFSFKLMV